MAAADADVLWGKTSRGGSKQGVAVARGAGA